MSFTIGGKVTASREKRLLRFCVNALHKAVDRIQIGPVGIARPLWVVGFEVVGEAFAGNGRREALFLVSERP